MLHRYERMHDLGWLYRCNRQRPHEALGCVPPVEYRVKLFPNLYFWLAQEFEGTSGALNNACDFGHQHRNRTPHFVP